MWTVDKKPGNAIMKKKKENIVAMFPINQQS